MQVDSGLKALVLIGKFFNTQINYQSIKHKTGIVTGQYAKPIDLINISKELGFKCKLKKLDVLKNGKLITPCIVFNNKNEYLLIAKVSNGNVLVQNPLLASPQSMTLERLIDDGYHGAILFAKNEGLMSDATKFGISWFFKAMKKYKKHVVDVIMASFFIQILALATPIFFQTVIDKVISHNGVSTLNVLIVGFIIITVTDFILNILRAYVQNHTANRLDASLGSELYKHLIHLPVSYFDSRKVGHTVARVKELENVRQFVTGSSITLIIDSFFTVVFFAVMFHYSTLLGFIVLLSVPFYFLIAALVTPALRKNLDEKFHYGAENQAFLVESISGIQTIKSKSLEPRFSGEWDRKLAKFSNSSFSVSQINNLGSNLTQLVSKSVTIAILWFGANAVLANEITIGQLIAVNIFAGRVSAPILRLAQLWQDFQQIHVSIKRLGEILNIPTEKNIKELENKLTEIDGDVSFENVTFSYNLKSKPVIKSLSFKAEKGKVIGLVGRSGSGKSTLTKILQKLYLPTEGRVLIDGIDVKHMDTAWLRSQIGVVLQENFLFSRTIKENISLSDPGVSDEEIIKSAKLAGAHDFIIEMPDGYNTILSEQGIGLSGGQKQRIAIARALITNPKILIFDEATSALDYESEAKIQQNMSEITKGRTVFIIAHRLSTVRDADEIIVLDKGEVVEKGSHDQLISKESGYYKTLNSFQTDMSVKGV
ncbi:peptidase domain-containing ABC transporter [Vibrio parahaemolyticus]|uniref:peptidase domain-containing ABC transporter n=1 Tax=Vibrio parahaemolyticus TaxID=670 RepID=UPI0006C33DA2|nr:peptidase C39 [Vibrio parahaemolyticus]